MGKFCGYVTTHFVNDCRRREAWKPGWETGRLMLNTSSNDEAISSGMFHLEQLIYTCAGKYR